MDKKCSGYLVIEVLLAAAISVVIFFTVTAFTSQIAELLVGPGATIVDSEAYPLSPNRYERSQKTNLITRAEELVGISESLILCDASIARSWSSSNGRLEFGGGSLYSLNPATLVDPVQVRSRLTAGGATFEQGYTIFFLGEDMNILGILRCTYEDSATHRAFDVSLQLGTSNTSDIGYAFAEELVYSQSAPTYSVLNLTGEYEPYFSVVLPDPADSFALRAKRLEGTLAVSREGLTGTNIILPFYP